MTTLPSCSPVNINSHKNVTTWAHDTCLINPACKIHKSGNATARSIENFHLLPISTPQSFNYAEKTDIASVTKIWTQGISSKLKLSGRSLVEWHQKEEATAAASQVSTDDLTQFMNSYWKGELQGALQQVDTISDNGHILHVNSLFSCVVGQIMPQLLAKHLVFFLTNKICQL